MLCKVISGGQTGADQGGLLAAEYLNISTYGVAPKGYRTENGFNTELKTRFGLTEHSSYKYPPRTEENIKNSDATILFSKVLSAGSDYTVAMCIKHDKPLFEWNFNNDTDSEYLRLSNFFMKHSNNKDYKVLNVAGNRESVSPGICREVELILIRAISGMFI